MALRKLVMPVEEWTKPELSGTGIEILKSEFWEEIVLVEKIVRDILTKNAADYPVRAEMKICESDEEFVSMPIFTIRLNNGSCFYLLSHSGSWIVSVDYSGKVKGDYGRIFDPVKQVDNSLCFEEFPEELIFLPFGQNRQRFTFEVESDCLLLTFFFYFSELNL